MILNGRIDVGEELEGVRPLLQAGGPTAQGDNDLRAKRDLSCSALGRMAATASGFRHPVGRRPACYARPVSIEFDLDPLMTRRRRRRPLDSAAEVGVDPQGGRLCSGAPSSRPCEMRVPVGSRPETGSSCFYGGPPEALKPVSDVAGPNMEGEVAVDGSGGSSGVAGYSGLENLLFVSGHVMAGSGSGGEADRTRAAEPRRGAPSL